MLLLSLHQCRILLEFMTTKKPQFMALALALGAMFSAPVAAITDLEAAINGYTEEQQALKEVIEEIVPAPEPTTNRMWTGKGFTEDEITVLNFFQDYGIKDRAALAVLMGNVKQESKFITNICEGGTRPGYAGCHRGGFGLIQWTTVGRYNGLGRHAASIGGNPNTLETQLSYLVTEVEWKKVQHIFKREGQSITTYMNAAYRWLGWGVHGARTTYSNQYYNQLTPT